MNHDVAAGNRASPRRALSVLLLSAAAVAGGGIAVAARAQQPDAAADYPNRPIRLVVGYGAGTSTDLQARFLAQKLSELVKQPIIVENKPGASASLGTQYALTFPADGYTLTLGGTTSHAANVGLFRNLPYDPLRDFVPISGLAIGGGAFVVKRDFPAKSISELIEMARRNPGKYSYAWSAAFSRVAFAALAAESKIDLLDVPYKGSASLATEVMAGTVDVTFEALVSLLPQIRAGNVRAIGVSTARRSADLPDVPTVAEQGVPGYQILGWTALFAKTGTPQPIVDKLNRLVVSILKTPEAAEFFRRNTAWEPMIMTPAETGRFLVSEVALWTEGVR
ncbi:MAG: Bug family tripartite tricarboxylate transporter substrate binding protein, partial [Lautropia sp.]